MVTRPRKHLHDPCGGVLCLDFVNCVGRPAGRPYRETLEGYEDLLAWCEQAGSLPAKDARRLRRLARDDAEGAAAVLARARTLREAIFRAFAAVVRGKRPGRRDLETLNAEVAGALGHARVAAKAGGFDWTWERCDSLAAPLWPIARSAADLLVSEELERVKECASDACLWLFLDRTKNRGRRWCEMKSCGNRAKVREHRRRKRREGG